jgi:hypothetical protein
MKKLALILTLSGLAATSFGQGFVNFANVSGNENVSTNTTLYINGNATGGGAGPGLVTGSGGAHFGYYYALLAQAYSGSGPTVATTIGTLLSTGWTYTGAWGTNALGGGRIAGGANTQTTAGMPTTGNPPNQFIIAGWSSNLGTDWATVSGQLATSGLNGAWTLSSGVGGVFGISSVGTGLGAASPPEAIFDAPGIATGFTLYEVPVPEPSTMALAGLGGLAVLLFRRRK